MALIDAPPPRRRAGRRFRRRTALPVILAMTLLTFACVSSEREATFFEERIQHAEEGLAEDPVVRAQVEVVRATRAREKSDQLVDELELRVEDDYLDDDHQLRVTARVPINRPSEVRAERDLMRAETQVSLSRLEEISLERRAELCFPAVETLAWNARRAVYESYAERHRALLEWNEDWRGLGMLDELTAARFELESRIKLASWEPPPVSLYEGPGFRLPEIDDGLGSLVRDPAYVRQTVRRHHPSVGVRRATAERYRALAARARARRQPWIKFVDVSYEHRTDDSDNGVGGQLAFEIPLGGRQLANAGRYEALVHQQRSQAESLVSEQIARSLQALNDIDDFETLASRWQKLEELARNADEIADRWWQQRLAKPSDVAALLDEAFDARSAVLEARERAGTAYCTVLAMTGVALEAWPREAAPVTVEPDS